MKKLLAVFLCLCLTLAACGASFAAESKDADMSALVDILTKVADYFDIDEKTPGEMDEYVKFFNGLKDAGPEKPDEEKEAELEKAYQERVGKIMSNILDYYEEKLTVDAFLDSITSDKEKDTNFLGIDRKAFKAADPDDDIFDKEDILYLLDYLGLVPEEGTEFNTEDFEEILFYLVFVLNMIDVVYGDVEDFDPLTVLMVLYGLDAMLEDGELTYEDYAAFIEEFNLEDVYEMLVFIEIESVISEAVSKALQKEDPDASVIDSIRAALAKLGYTPAEIEAIIAYYGLETSGAISDETLKSYAENYKKLVDKLTKFGYTKEQIDALIAAFDIAYLLGVSDKDMLDLLAEKYPMSEEEKQAIKEAAVQYMLDSLGLTEYLRAGLLESYSIDELFNLGEAGITNYIIESIYKGLSAHLDTAILDMMRSSGYNLLDLLELDIEGVFAAVNAYAESAFEPYKAILAAGGVTEEELTKLLEKYKKAEILLMDEAELAAALAEIRSGDKPAEEDEDPDEGPDEETKKNFINSSFGAYYSEAVDTYFNNEYMDATQLPSYGITEQSVKDRLFDDLLKLIVADVEYDAEGNAIYSLSYSQALTEMIRVCIEEMLDEYDAGGGSEGGGETEPVIDPAFETEFWNKVENWINDHISQIYNSKPDLDVNNDGEVSIDEAKSIIALAAYLSLREQDSSYEVEAYLNNLFFGGNAGA